MHPYHTAARAEQHSTALLADAAHARQVRLARRRTYPAPRLRRWWEPLFTRRSAHPVRTPARPAVA